MDNNIKIPDEFKHSPQSELGKKLDNFWYYNKWKVIVGAFLLVVLIICTVQCVTRPKYDVQVLYGGALSSSNSITQDMQSALSEVKPDSLGKNEAGLTVLEIYSDEYVAKNQNTVNAYNNSKNYEDFCQLITAGEYSILILDKWIYDDIKSKVGFREIDEIAGKDVISDDQKYDNSAVYLKKTDFYQRYYGAFSSLPDDTVVCLCIYSPYKSTVGCGKSSDNSYEASIEMFKTILTYKQH